MLCGELHCQKCFNRILFSYKIVPPSMEGFGVRASDVGIGIRVQRLGIRVKGVGCRSYF